MTEGSATVNETQATQPRIGRTPPWDHLYGEMTMRSQKRERPFATLRSQPSTPMDTHESGSLVTYLQGSDVGRFRLEGLPYANGLQLQC
jgi:hypothetical protein